MFFALIVATEYEIRPDPEDGLLRIHNKRAPICPDCGSLCSGYDSRIRKLIRADGSEEIFRLRRLRCCSCRKLHVEIPDIMAPRKHYERAAIEEARAGSDDVAAEDSTIRRWRK